MGKMSWNTTTIQFPVGPWIRQPYQLPNQTPYTPTSDTHALTIFNTNNKKLYCPNETNVYTRWYSKNGECEIFISILTFIIFSFFSLLLSMWMVIYLQGCDNLDPEELSLSWVNCHYVTKFFTLWLTKWLRLHHMSYHIYKQVHYSKLRSRRSEIDSS